MPSAIDTGWTVSNLVHLHRAIRRQPALDVLDSAQVQQTAIDLIAAVLCWSRTFGADPEAALAAAYTAFEADAPGAPPLMEHPISVLRGIFRVLDASADWDADAMQAISILLAHCGWFFHQHEFCRDESCAHPLCKAGEVFDPLEFIVAAFAPADSRRAARKDTDVPERNFFPDLDAVREHLRNPPPTAFGKHGDPEARRAYLAAVAENPTLVLSRRGGLIAWRQRQIGGAPVWLVAPAGVVWHLNAARYGVTGKTTARTFMRLVESALALPWAADRLPAAISARRRDLGRDLDDELCRLAAGHRQLDPDGVLAARVADLDQDRALAARAMEREAAAGYTDTITVRQIQPGDEIAFSYGVGALAPAWQGAATARNGMFMLTIRGALVEVCFDPRKSPVEREPRGTAVAFHVTNLPRRGIQGELVCAHQLLRHFQLTPEFIFSAVDVTSTADYRKHSAYVDLTSTVWEVIANGRSLGAVDAVSTRRCHG